MEPDIISFLAQQRAAENDRLANAPDDLLAALAAYGVIPEQQQVEALNYKNALGMQNTEMPEGTRTRNAYVAASPVATLAAALRQGVGMRNATASQQAMADALRKKAAYNQQIGNYERDFARRQLAAPTPPPVQPQVDPMEAWLGNGYDPLSGVR